MSKGKYGDLEISEEQRKRLEEERRRRREEERRRQEEARKREIERCRLEEIRAEKERIALARRFRETSAALQRQPLGRQHREKRTERWVPDLSGEMSERVRAMKKQLEAFPELWRDFFADELKQVREIIHKTEQCGFDPYYHPRLKEAFGELAGLAARAEGETEKIFQRIREIRETCEKLVTELAVIAENAPLEEQRHRARTIVDGLVSLIQDPRLDIRMQRLEYLKKEGRRLCDEYDEVLEAEQVRGFLVKNIREVLGEMGYRALETESLPQQRIPEDSAAEQVLYFHTPRQGVVDVGLGADHTFVAGYVLPRRAGSAEQTAGREVIDDCRRWCRDYEELIRMLSARDVYVHEKWRTGPDEGRFKEVVFPEAFFAAEDMPAFLPKEPKRREL